MEDANPISLSVDRIRKESTSSRSTAISHELVAFDDVIAKDDLRRTNLQKTRPNNTRTHSSGGSSKSQKKGAAAPTTSTAADKKRPASIAVDSRSLYGRVIGKTPLTTTPMRPSPNQPIKNSIFGWFSKETSEVIFLHLL